MKQIQHCLHMHACLTWHTRLPTAPAAADTHTTLPASGQRILLTPCHAVRPITKEQTDRSAVMGSPSRFMAG